MKAYDLSDEQWCLLDLLMRARQRGVDRISRAEMLASDTLPTGVRLKLTWAALTMPADILSWHGQHEFSITETGIALFQLRFGTASTPASPTHVADIVICLPGPEHYVN